MPSEEKQGEIEEKILEVLNKSLFGMSITEIADNTEINRMTAAKYLEILRAKELVFNKSVGTSKLWLPVQRSFDQRLKLTVQYFQWFSRAVQEILEDTNYEKTRLIGKKFGKTIFDIYFTPQMRNQKFTELIQECAAAMEEVYPIPSKIDAIILDENTAEVIINPCICEGRMENKSICELQIGLIMGIAEQIFNNVSVAEKECMCDGSPYCSYHIQYSPE
jgi:predicted hydrocarbon binding protein